ncbi:hypothetical protein E0493_13845 [Roseomonas sp. M0104]|uniref:Uncharacterized protein n=1 Tax=Teichococcus coralli TaxID=2545983 RepID=A0A845BLZ2_9PROT|nr:hypothetical protein [Pseudoroseomonas coralli]MXP64429.1 hypothetical protein [Pseudoroseomonas coralli]
MNQASPMLPAHPEEMHARVEISLGGGRTLTAAARATPAGLIAAAILVAAVLLSATALLRARGAGPQAGRAPPGR